MPEESSEEELPLASVDTPLGEVRVVEWDAAGPADGIREWPSNPVREVTEEFTIGAHSTRTDHADPVQQVLGPRVEDGLSADAPTFGDGLINLLRNVVGFNTVPPEESNGEELPIASVDTPLGEVREDEWDVAGPAAGPADGVGEWPSNPALEVMDELTAVAHSTRTDQSDPVQQVLGPRVEDGLSADAPTFGDGLINLLRNVVGFNTVPPEESNGEELPIASVDTPLGEVREDEWDVAGPAAGPADGVGEWPSNPALEVTDELTAVAHSTQANQADPVQQVLGPRVEDGLSSDASTARADQINRQYSVWGSFTEAYAAGLTGQDGASQGKN